MTYSIFTPTKNEGKYIEQLIKSVISQEILPQEWFIMDDNSTDNTAEIVQKYLADNSFIKYIKLTNYRTELVNTGGRVAAIINYADSLRTKDVDIISKIDGDTSFDPDFFKNIISEFLKDDKLGIASGRLVENGVPERIKSPITCRGASMIIRYKCFLEIGKFYESKSRGEDVLATVAARAKGYKTGNFGYYFNHLKPEGIRKSNLKNQYITGYYKGSVPYLLPFYFLNVIRDLSKKPYIIGAFVQFLAYFYSRYIKRYRPFPDFVSTQFRLEQKNKLRKLLGFHKK